MQIPKSNIAPDFTKLNWRVNCCDQERPEKFIKTITHDISSLFNLESGIAYFNCRYCTDNPHCYEKALARGWIVDKYFSKFLAPPEGTENGA